METKNKRVINYNKNGLWEHNLFLRLNMNFKMVYARELEEYVKKRRASLVDLRDAVAYRAGHWKNARNLPYEGEWNLANFYTKERYVIFYCEHGGNSMLAAREYGRLGFKTGSVVGGYEAMKKYFSENYFKIEENMQE